MSPLLIKEEMGAIDSGDELEDEPMYTEMLEDIRDSSQSHPIVNRRDAHYKIRDRIKQIQLECKGGLKATQKMGKVLHKVFKTVVKQIRNICLWDNLVHKFPISFQNLEIFLRSQDCQMISRNLG